MDFAFSEEQGFIRDTIQKFIARECDREVVKKLDEDGQYPEKLFQTIAQMGFCGLTVPQEYGGGGLDSLGAAMVTEELAAISPVLAGAFCATTFSGGLVISNLGSTDQKEALLPEIVQGDLCVAFGVE
ncbi:MAG: acyl-CoA dehydrogenase family protein, partial [Desulfomonilia bacterium]|nr:acyl-CoA dehydrogenase family protein [Desulfomonilia bacterium]